VWTEFYSQILPFTKENFWKENNSQHKVVGFGIKQIWADTQIRPYSIGAGRSAYYYPAKLARLTRRQKSEDRGRKDVNT